MKLFGNTSGKHLKNNTPSAPAGGRRTALRFEAEPELSAELRPEPKQEPSPASEPVPAPASAAKPETKAVSEPPPTAETQEPPALQQAQEPPPEPVPEPQIAAAEIRSAEAPPAAATASPAAVKRRSRFGAGLAIYAGVMVLLILAGLALLWQRMDVYERSRPFHAMERYMAAGSGGRWTELLAERGVEDSFLRTLHPETAEYYKLLGSYTDEKPVYGVRFDGKTLLHVTLRKGAELAFGAHEWEVGDVALTDSGLLVYAPGDAVITVRGEPIGADRLVQADAQPLTLGVFEEWRTDIPGLSKYRIDEIFGIDHLTVTDAAGNELPLSYSSGNAYYYAPLTGGCVITAPSSATVTLNGVLLTEENAAVERRALEDFEGIESFLPVVPETVTYSVEGLVAEPWVEASVDEVLLARAEAGDGRYLFTLANDEALAEELSDRILTVFDAYIAFSGNRASNLAGNYSRYLAYLVPGSEAADRASRARESLKWVGGRDSALAAVNLKEVIRYDADLFTARLDFTLKSDETEDANSCLFIFVRWQNEWRVVRILNKTSFI